MSLIKGHISIPSASVKTRQSQTPQFTPGTPFAAIVLRCFILSSYTNCIWRQNQTAPLEILITCYSWARKLLFSTVSTIGPLSEIMTLSTKLEVQQQQQQQPVWRHFVWYELVSRYQKKSIHSLTHSLTPCVCGCCTTHLINFINFLRSIVSSLHMC